MKVIWSNCARAFSLPGMGKKRTRGDDAQEETVLPESKKPKMGGSDGKCTDRTDVYNCADYKILKLKIYLTHN